MKEQCVKGNLQSGPHEFGVAKYMDFHFRETTALCGASPNKSHASCNLNVPSARLPNCLKIISHHTLSWLLDMDQLNSESAMLRLSFVWLCQPHPSPLKWECLLCALVYWRVLLSVWWVSQTGFRFEILYNNELPGLWELRGRPTAFWISRFTWASWGSRVNYYGINVEVFPQILQSWYLMVAPGRKGEVTWSDYKVHTIFLTGTFLPPPGCHGLKSISPPQSCAMLFCYGVN